MTWIKFALSVCGIYAAYYAAVICWDVFWGIAAGKQQESHQLTFDEYLEPQKAEPQYPSGYPPSAVVASGGIRLKQLFSLSLEQAVEYTREVSY